MKLKVFFSFLTLINVYFFYVCQPVLADGTAGKYCAQLFSGNGDLYGESGDSATHISDIWEKDHEENVYAVHITKYLPSDGFLRAVTKDRGRFLPTLHFSLGEPVVDHPFGKWSQKPYAIVTPVKSLRNQLLNVYPQDAFILGNFKIPEDAVLFIPRGDPLPQGLPFRIIQYNKFLGVKPAVSQFLRESGSIEFQAINKVKNISPDEILIGETNLLKDDNLKKFFPQLFKDKPFLTQTLHALTNWGQIDGVVINYFSNWMSGKVISNRLQTDIDLSLHILRDDLLATNRLVARMGLPDYALESYKESLLEVKSYINILEVEKDLRAKGHSILALEGNTNIKLFSKILSLRNQKQKLWDFSLSVLEQLPEPAPIPKSIPLNYKIELKNSSMSQFVQYLKTDFPKPDAKTQHQIHLAIASRAFQFLLAGKLTAEEAYPYFRMNAESLTWGDLVIHIFGNTLYQVAEYEDYRLSSPNKELLRFLKNPWVHQFIISKKMLENLSSEDMANYLKKLDSVDMLTPAH